MRDAFFLTAGTFDVPAASVRSPVDLAPLGLLERFSPFKLANTVAVVVRDNGDVVLVDCGFSRETCRDPVKTLGRVQTMGLGLRVKQEESAVEQLARHGIPKERVKAIVATHFHLDHIGGTRDFPNAELVCNDLELAAASLKPPAGGYRPADWDGARLRPVRLTSGPSYGFGASHDVFGDGEIVLLDAHGHTAGMIAVAIRSRGDRDQTTCYVHIGDAAYQAWEWGLSPRGPGLIMKLISWRPDLLPQRYASLRDCEADPRRPVLVPSHDLAVFNRLPHAPKSAENIGISGTTPPA
ncbi:MAG TPA: MBL fold metallo-hydrolase [Polyangiaceae bacterium]